MSKKFFLIVALCIVVMLLVSCASRALRRVEQFGDIIDKDQYIAAIKKIRASPRLYGNLNRFLYWYDQAVLFHYAQEFDSSRVHFEKAEATLDELYARSIANEAASLLTNDNLRPYRSRRYEEIMLHQFLSNNYAARSAFDEALVETRKVQMVFDRFAQKDRGKDRYAQDGMSHYLSSILYDAQGESDNAVISLFHAVQAYQNGPVALPPLVGGTACYRLQEAGRDADLGTLGLNPRSFPPAAPSAGGNTGEVVLIGYAGKGPVLKETLFWGTYVVGGMIIGYYANPYGDTVAVALPAPPLPESELRKLRTNEKTRAGTTFHIKFTLPSPVNRPSRTDRFEVRIPTASAMVQSTVLSNTENLLARDIEDNRTVTLVRTAVRVVLRTLAAEKAKDQLTTNQPLVNLLVNVGADVLADQMEKADTRLCFFLPRTIQIARIAVPAGTHTVDAAALDRSGTPIGSRRFESVVVQPGKPTYLFYSSLQ